MDIRTNVECSQNRLILRAFDVMRKCTKAPTNTIEQFEIHCCISGPLNAEHDSMQFRMHSIAVRKKQYISHLSKSDSNYLNYAGVHYRLVGVIYYLLGPGSAYYGTTCTVSFHSQMAVGLSGMGIAKVFVFITSCCKQPPIEVSRRLGVAEAIFHPSLTPPPACRLR